MKNWMVELEHKTDPDSSALTIQLIAAALVLATIVAGNWYFFT